MWLYQKKLTELESDFKDAKDAIRKIQKALENPEGASEGADKETDRATIKLRLDVALALVRLIKEQTAFYAKLGKKFDAFKLAEGIIYRLLSEDPGLAKRIVEDLNREWGFDIPYPGEVQEEDQEQDDPS